MAGYFQKNLRTHSPSNCHFNSQCCLGDSATCVKLFLFLFLFFSQWIRRYGSTCRPIFSRCIRSYFCIFCCKQQYLNLNFCCESKHYNLFKQPYDKLVVFGVYTFFRQTSGIPIVFLLRLQLVISIVSVFLPFFPASSNTLTPVISSLAQWQRA